MTDLLEQIDRENLPRHIAIIMDGNGRWAKKHGKNRYYGHQAGVESVRKITEAATRLGIKYLTLYTFSTENWNRPVEEVEGLMHLLVESIQKETPTFQKNNIQFRVIGDMSVMPKTAKEKLDQCIEDTNKNTGLTLILAISYSSRWEITNAAKILADDVKRGKINASQINEESFSKNLSTNTYPDPDLLIRTSGELRISNFLLWQIAYTELYFTETLWPDFNENEFYQAIINYQQRERRFGKTSEQI